MAKYTVTIKSLIDNNFNFGLNSYPIFDENYRSTLNNNILNHYYINEIGFETANLFKFYLNQTMSEIMPAYNVLYIAQKHLLDNNLLFNNVNISENLQGADSSSSSLSSSSSDSSSSNNSSSDSSSSNNSSSDLSSNNSSSNNSSSNSGSSTSSSNSTSSGNSKSLFQDTPQGQLSNTDINNPSWATNLTLGSNSASNSISDSSSQSSQSSDSGQQSSQYSNNSNSSASSSSNSSGSSSSSSNSSGSSSSSSSSNNSYIKTIIGNNGSISNIELLNLISDNFYSIDLKIIHDLRDLFMMIF